LEGLVSVVIPVYNGERFIKDAVNSAINQTYSDIEIVIVDDASKDRTEEIIFGSFNDLIGKKIHYYRNEKNMERAYSRNFGVSKAKGSFIFFLDYDDIWEKGYVSESVKYLQEYDIVYSFPRTFIDEKGKVIRRSTKKIPKTIEEILYSSMIGYPTATALRKEKFSGYKDKYIPREDWEFFLRSFKEGLKIKILDNDKVFMREHGGRTSRNPVFWRSTLKVYQDYINQIPDEYHHLFLFSIGEVCLRFGDLKTGWKLIIESLKKEPSLLADKRRLLSVLKRGFRIDRILKKGGSPSQ